MLDASVVDMALAMSVAIVGGVLFAFAAPLRVLAFTWAALLPIYAIGPLSPAMLDLARYGLAMAIGVRALLAYDCNSGTRSVRRWATAIVVLGGWVALVGHLRPDGFDAQIGTAVVVSALVAAFALSRLPDPMPLLTGFSAGATLSGLVILASAAGIGLAGTIAPGLTSGTTRFQGLSSGSTKVAGELAIAIIVFGLQALHQKRHRLILAIGVTFCSGALLLSGGRGGLAMVIFAAVLLIIRRRLTARGLAMALALAASVFWWLADRGFNVNTISRILVPSRTSDFTTGRGNLNEAAFESIVQGGYISEGSTPFLLMHGSTAHFAPLTFGVAGGVVALAVASGLVLALGRAMFYRADTTGMYVGLAAALFAYTLIEPMGPFAGMTSVTILLACVMGLSSSSSDPPPESLRHRSGRALVSMTTAQRSARLPPRHGMKTDVAVG